MTLIPIVPVQASHAVLHKRILREPALTVLASFHVGRQCDSFRGGSQQKHPTPWTRESALPSARASAHSSPTILYIRDGSEPGSPFSLTA